VYNMKNRVLSLFDPRRRHRYCVVD